MESQVVRDNPREKLGSLKCFLEKNGFGTRSLPKNKNQLCSKMHDGTFFFIALSKRDGFKFHWEANNHDEGWFNDRKNTISKSFPGSCVTVKEVCRLFIPVDQEHYSESILKIVKETRSVMGYNIK
jgi:hypothetical protein